MQRNLSIAGSDCPGATEWLGDCRQPGGGADDENRLLEECLDTLKLGTNSVRLRRIAT